jgi:hypothetical protein
VPLPATQPIEWFQYGIVTARHENYRVTRYGNRCRISAMSTQFDLPPEILEQIQRFKEAKRTVDALIAQNPQIAAGIKWVLEQPEGGYPSNIRMP